MIFTKIKMIRFLNPQTILGCVTNLGFVGLKIKIFFFQINEFE
ncbi:MAG: hypothetical protein RL329_1529 [Bacteroidota bacterium]|jgi:hypothetical protein